MEGMKQFEVWWENLPEPASLLNEKEGLPKVCAANSDSLRMVPRLSLTKHAGELAPERWVEVRRAVGAALGWRELTDLE